MEKSKIIDLLQARGYNPAAIAGILGNIAVETGGTYDYKQKQHKGNGYGLFQFDFMKKPYQRWLKANKLKDSAESQIDFFHDSIYGKNQNFIGAGNAAQLRKVLASNDPAGIATTLSDVYLRPGKPHLERRVAEAQKTYSSLQPVQEPVQVAAASDLAFANAAKDFMNPLAVNPLMVAP